MITRGGKLSKNQDKISIIRRLGGDLRWPVARAEGGGKTGHLVRRCPQITVMKRPSTARRSATCPSRDLHRSVRNIIRRQRPLKLNTGCHSEFGK